MIKLLIPKHATLISKHPVYYNLLIVKKDILYLQQNRHDLFKLKPIFE